ncbi:Ig-like domain-containing protein [Methanoculleus sp.]|uniref:Ig-like domain-containing protein n=1 Tax=Methanoculleus sp. TaxID=90427 RepID=UPI0026044FA9|nr:Ig-like domain-containing protein [Methanoculleus sp.]MDI6867929.1 Ig-like domain-containing protein [Methanoculleus sp.]
MDFTKVFLLMILLGLIVPAVSATGPDRIIISSDVGWLAAGGTDTAEITVQVLDGSGMPLENCTVVFEVDPAFGRISPTAVTTGTSGTAAATFSPGTASGVAVITARAGTVEETFFLPIDHGPANRITYLDYEFEVAAGTVTVITVGLADRYGNPVDDTRVPETVRFSVGSVCDDAVFIDDGGVPVPEIERTVNATGFVQVPFRTGRTVGENIVRIAVPSGGIDRYISIRGLPTGHPAAIAVLVNPDADPNPYQPADGQSTFTLTYRLFDAWGNPAAGRDIRVTTTLAGEDTILTTNGSGVACLTYGPKDTTGRITVTATAVDNTSVTVSQVVEFVHTAPVEMLLSASPQSMPSLDVPGSQPATLRAKVVDVKGNPVGGEEVAFAIRNVDTGEFAQVAAPYLSAPSAVTDEDGYAVVRFYPGAFTTDRRDPRWSAAARGECGVVATWNGTTRTIPLAWENYPYLSVEATVSPETVAVNDTVDVTIRLKGDGWAFRPDPVDVVLCTDRSGSMLYDDPDRMHSVREAAKVFVDQFSENYDRAAAVSFGGKGRISRPGASSGIGAHEIDNDYTYPKTYSDYATLDTGLTYDLQAVKDALDGIVPDHGTPLRHGLKVSIDHLVAGADGGSVKAVVLLSDGDYNWYGDPLARGSGSTRSSPDGYGTLTRNYYRYEDLPLRWQNLAAYAADNEIRIFTISYSESLSGDARSTLQSIAESTGGRYYHAPAPDALGPIYADIAGALKTEAGVNTTINIDFGTIQVNSEEREGGRVFSYVYEDGVSTVIESAVENETGHYVIVPRRTLNQTDDWNDDRNLAFEIGTVHLGQTWEATFRLRVLTDGNINIFGPGSAIRFNDAAELALPDTFVTAVPDLSNTGFGSATLALSNPRYTCAEPVEEILSVAWDLTYTGTGTVTESVEYSNDGGLSWVRFDVLSPDGTVVGETSSLHVRGLPPGEYLIRVRASADDVPDAGLLFPPIQVGERRQAYIRLM